MTTRKVSIGLAPKLPQSEAIEAFVSAPAREVNAAPAAPQVQHQVEPLPIIESKQRFPIELPLSMHTFLRAYCAGRRKTLREELMPLIEEHAKKLGYIPPQ